MSIIRIYLKADSIVSGNIAVTTNINIIPIVNRYTATVVLGDILGGVTTIPAQSFTNDSGASVATNGLTVPTSSGYYNVFVNGTLQQGGLTTLSTANLIINTGLVVGVTVVIEVINFNTSASSTSVNNVTVTTTISD
ncbi:hypothetical protein HPL003_16495 [Paenibacillus terrae HPL-003]|uniref:DUF4183 domain-containing protein n=1 Tax=Paenibacillus terrae (strain HPL-003) TaxID=985665 RepID=G7W2E1_PAETH|nr:DUF4183 domain-containing protein [Paenibacillus terrae]AET60045.1 hypothetical protein HPL003_16495 [Paenibacillus terrae HPL-003]